MVPELPLLLSVSAQQLRNPQLVDCLLTSLWNNGLPTDALTINTTEAALADDDERVRATLTRSTRRACHFKSTHSEVVTHLSRYFEG